MISIEKIAQNVELLVTAYNSYENRKKNIQFGHVKAKEKNYNEACKAFVVESLCFSYELDANEIMFSAIHATSDVRAMAYYILNTYAKINCRKISFLFKREKAAGYIKKKINQIKFQIEKDLYPQKIEIIKKIGNKIEQIKAKEYTNE